MPSRIETLEFHGQPALALNTAGGASAVVSLFGGQVLSWIPAGGTERLYLSPKAQRDGVSPVRGGIPVCFPQFSELGKLPKHGFARTCMWEVTDQRTGDDFALVTLRLDDSDATWAIWPNAFRLELTVLLEGERLNVELEVMNTGHTTFAFTAALHTYLYVNEVENVRLEGLYGHEYRDAANQDRITRDSGDTLMIESETDRVYHNVERALLLRNGGRSLGIQNDGFPDVVVWNPWEDRCAALSDMPSNGFRQMLCVEAAAARHKIQLDAGADWVGRQSLVAL